MTFMIVPAASGDRNSSSLKQPCSRRLAACSSKTCFQASYSATAWVITSVVISPAFPPVILFSYRKKIYQGAAVDASAEEHEFLDPEEYETWNALLSLSQATLHALDVELQSSAGRPGTQVDLLITPFNA